MRQRGMPKAYPTTNKSVRNSEQTNQFILPLQKQNIQVESRGGQYRGTFLVPLSVPSLLFKNCTFFGTADTFFALLSSIFGTICEMEF